MATTTQSQILTNLLAQPSTILGRASFGTDVLIRKYSANSADRTAIGTWSGTINDLFIVLPLDWFDCIHSIKLFNDAMDTNGSPTLTLDLGVGYITPAANDGSTAATLTTSNATIYAAASTALQAASATGGAEIMTRTITDLGLGAGVTAQTPNRVLDDAGLTTAPMGSMPVLIMKAHAAAATAASAPKFALLVAFTR
jgi:hypothetical protein